MIKMSETIQELAAALAKAQAKLPGAARRCENLEFNIRYADLSGIWAACRGVLSRNGLSVVQFPGDVVDGRVTLTTMLMHSSGEWLQQALSIPVPTMDATGYGAATTYARRYALVAVVGVCPADDPSLPPQQRRRDSSTSAPAGPIDADQLGALTALADEVCADLTALCAYLGVTSLRDLPAAQYEAALRALEQKRGLTRRAA